VMTTGTTTKSGATKLRRHLSAKKKGSSLPELPTSKYFFFHWLLKKH